MCVPEKYYAVTAGHCIQEGEECYKTSQCLQYLGKCVLSRTLLQPPKTMDMALIEIDKKYELTNNIHSATGDECGFKLPDTEQDVCDMECWKVKWNPFTSINRRLFIWMFYRQTYNNTLSQIYIFRIYRIFRMLKYCSGTFINFKFPKLNCLHEYSDQWAKSLSWKRFVSKGS